MRSEEKSMNQAVVSHATALIVVEDGFFHGARIDGWTYASAFSDHHVQRAHELIFRVRFQNVTSSSCPERAAHKFRGRMQGEQQNFSFRKHVVDNARRFEAIHAGHGYVHDDHLGHKLTGEPNSILPVVGLTAQVPFRMSTQYPLNPTAYHRMVIDNQNAWHNSLSYNQPPASQKFLCLDNLVS